MEHVCGILTAALLWLFILHEIHEQRSRGRRKAGRLLLKLDKEHSSLSWAGVLLSVGFCAANFCAYACSLVYSSGGCLMITPFGTFLLAFSILTGICSWRLGTQNLELREHGIVFARGRPIIFAPWHYIQWYRWKDDRTKLFVQYPKIGKSYPILADQANAADAILTQHVRVRGTDGVTLADGTRHGVVTESKEAGDLPVAEDPGPENREPEHPEPKNPEPENPEPENPEPEIQRWQFSLRTLLLLMLLCSSVFGWRSVRSRAEEQRKQAVADFAKMRPSVAYSGTDVIGLDFSWGPIKPADEDLAHLSKLPRLESLRLNGAPITDAGLKHLRGLKSLRYIHLNGTQVTDAGLKHLAELTSLRGVYVNGTQVTGEGFKELQRALPDAGISFRSPFPRPQPASRGTEPE